MALLHYFQSQKLSARGRDLAEIDTDIQKLPSDMHVLYRDLLQIISSEDKSEAQQIFQWIAFAEEPLTPKDLRCVLLVYSKKSLDNLVELEKYPISTSFYFHHLRHGCPFSRRSSAG